MNKIIFILFFLSLNVWAKLDANSKYGINEVLGKNFSAQFTTPSCLNAGSGGDEVSICSPMKDDKSQLNQVFFENYKCAEGVCETFRQKKTRMASQAQSLCQALDEKYLPLKEVLFYIPEDAKDTPCGKEASLTAVNAGWSCRKHRNIKTKGCGDINNMMAYCRHIFDNATNGNPLGNIIEGDVSSVDQKIKSRLQFLEGKGSLISSLVACDISNKYSKVLNVCLELSKEPNEQECSVLSDSSPTIEEKIEVTGALQAGLLESFKSMGTVDLTSDTRLIDFNNPKPTFETYFKGRNCLNLISDSQIKFEEFLKDASVVNSLTPKEISKMLQVLDSSSSHRAGQVSAILVAQLSSKGTNLATLTEELKNSGYCQKKAGECKVSSTVSSASAPACTMTGCLCNNSLKVGNLNESSNSTSFACVQTINGVEKNFQLTTQREAGQIGTKCTLSAQDGSCSTNDASLSKDKAYYDLANMIGKAKADDNSAKELRKAFDALIETNNPM